MQIIGQTEKIHRCYDELPRRKRFKSHPDRVIPGTIAECSCGTRYVWEYQGRSETWSWIRLEVSNTWKAKL